MARELQYLTVQDHLWINLQATGQQQPFKFAALEEATYLQYGYGGSSDIIAQATRYGAGFGAKSPFRNGNEATAFVGLVAFMRINGFAVDVTDAKGADFLSSLASGGEEVLRKAVRHDHQHHSESVAEATQAILSAYPKTIKKLAKQSS